jgi:mevalonate kinase
MPAISASAPGKAILLGEHAVVYGQPAIAIPVMQVQAKASVFPLIQAPSGKIVVDAPAVQLNTELSHLPEDNPIRILITLIADELGIRKFPAFQLKINSTIPIAAGLGSGASISVAVTRAITAFVGSPLPDDRISAIAYEVEKTYHGNPSGIDNTVITYAQPLYYVRDLPFELLKISTPLTFIIADSGIKSSTVQVVDQVKTAWMKEPERYEKKFHQIGTISQYGRIDIEQGNVKNLGILMNQNHEILQEISISCPEIDLLVSAAISAGAYGAKVSGAGQGGNMIALVPETQTDQIATALQKAGATRTIITHLFHQ